MKKKSLGKVAYDAFWEGEKDPFGIDDTDKKIFNRVAKAVAREVRKRDDARYEKLRQQARANAVTVAGNY